jgi:hypothetical protein
MWRKQIRAERAAEEAKVLTDRAAALREEALARPDSRDGFEGSGDTSENEVDNGTTNTHAPGGGIAGRALGRAADSLRGAAWLVRGHTEESIDGKPAGHP